MTNKATHLRLTLLDKYICGLESINAGESVLWKITSIDDNFVCIKNKREENAITMADFEKGYFVIGRNLSFPNGFNVKIEPIYKPHWWSKEVNLANVISNPKK